MTSTGDVLGQGFVEVGTPFGPVPDLVTTDRIVEALLALGWPAGAVALTTNVTIDGREMTLTHLDPGTGRRFLTWTVPVRHVTTDVAEPSWERTAVEVTRLAHALFALEQRGEQLDRQPAHVVESFTRWAESVVREGHRSGRLTSGKPS